MTDFYVDLTNGTDGTNATTVHDGKREPTATNYTAIASTDATHVYIAQGALDNDTDDNYNGDFLYNVTRSAGALISDYDADDGGGNSVLTTGSIASQASGDTFFILRALKTIEKFTSTGDARTAGDTCYVRANTTETVGAADIAFDEDGTAAAILKVIGCDATTNDPWDDNSNTKPIIDFNGGAYQFITGGDDYWELNRLAIRNSSDTTGNFAHGTSRLWRLVDCKFYDTVGTGSAVAGLNISGRCQAYLSGCEFVDNNTMNVMVASGSLARFDTCTFNGGAGGTTTGVVVRGAEAYFDGCSFGVTTAHATTDLAIDSSQVWLRNCTLTTLPAASAFGANGGGQLFWEDCTMPNSWASTGHANYHWLVQQETTAVRAGGGAVSAKVLPLASGGTGGAYAPMSLAGNYGFLARPIQLWGVADTSYTVTVYIRPIDAWATYPVASNLWLEASYLDHATNHTRTTVKSNDVLTGNDGSTWVAYDVTFQPAQTGPIYLDVVMTAYEATKGIYVDLTPVVS